MAILVLAGCHGTPADDAGDDCTPATEMVLDAGTDALPADGAAAGFDDCLPICGRGSFSCNMIGPTTVRCSGVCGR